MKRVVFLFSMIIGFCFFAEAVEKTAEEETQSNPRAAYIEKAKATLSEGFAAWNDSRFADSSRKFGELVTDESRKDFTEIYFEALLRKEKMDLLGLRSQRNQKYFDELISSVNQYAWKSSFEREMFFGRVQRLRGSYLSAVGDYQGSNRSLDMAIASFKKLGKSGSLGWALLHRSANFMSMDQIDEAKKDLQAVEAALKQGLKPEDQSYWSFYHRGKARMLAKQGQIAEAEKELQVGVEKIKLSKPSLRFARLVLMEDEVILAVVAGNRALAETRMKALTAEAKGTGMEAVYREFNAIWSGYLENQDLKALEGQLAKFVGRGFEKGKADWILGLLESKAAM
ncbi:MAG: hypothetical protein H6624_11740 [Bdellovibrionaceae bacterium]|nr:hypothetical protein [Bdellovibrionales bacterium]MCB9085012.1 hypothetical protein [Pseudobdellovibrionaceae bacterium]